MAFKKVTKEEFYNRLKNEKRDIILKVVDGPFENSYPYTSHFVTRFNTTIFFGKIVPSKSTYPYDDEYFVNEN